MVESMEAAGLVGPYNGSRSREVMLTLEEWQVQEEAMEEELAGLDPESAYQDDAEVEPAGSEDAPAAAAADTSTSKAHTP